MKLNPGCNSTWPNQVVLKGELDLRSDSPARHSGFKKDFLNFLNFRLDVISVCFFMTFQDCCQLYCYSKDPALNSMNIPLNYHSIV